MSYNGGTVTAIDTSFRYNSIVFDLPSIPKQIRSDVHQLTATFYFNAPEKSDLNAKQRIELECANKQLLASSDGCCVGLASNICEILGSVVSVISM